MDLFAARKRNDSPLADRMRPKRLPDVVGQQHLLDKGRILARSIAADRIPSMVLWGPPGTGKTTLATVIAAETNSSYVAFSAVLGGVAELRKIVAAAREKKNFYGTRTILFVDEIHRFNKSQQDALLPHVEDGTVTLVGATTENPSFAVNSALLSRARVFELKPLDPADLRKLLERALTDDGGLAHALESVDSDALDAIAHHARGDARRALSGLELASDYARACKAERVDVATVDEAFANQTLLYDKSGEEHYNVVSAFIKSLRGNDPDAAMYWMMRMLDAGEDPLFVLRRMLIFASEDIGNADPRALQAAVNADAAFRRLGMPEGLYAMTQCCTYLASAPKSNSAVHAISAVRKDIAAHGALPVPLKLRNAPTKHMKAWGYGDGYRYPHAEGGHSAGETYLPDKLVGARYYQPRNAGLEIQIRQRLKRLREQGTEEANGNRHDDKAK